MPVFSIGFDASSIRPGAVDASRSLDLVATSAGKAEKDVKSLSSTLKSAAQTALAMVGAYKAMSGVSSFMRGGVEYNTQLENAKLGIAAVMATTVELENAQGRLLQGAEKFAAAQQMSAKMAKALDVASMQSPAQYTDLLEAFQTMLAPAAQLGLSWQNTLDVTMSMSNTLASMNIPMERLARETQAILTGKGLSQSDVAKRLGITKEDIESWGQGEKLLENFTKRFEQMQYVGVAVEQTFSAVSAYFDDSLQSLSAEIGKGYFDSLKDSMLSVADALYVIDEQTKEFKITEEMQPLVDLLKDIASWSGEKFASSIKSLMSALQGLSSFVKDNREQLGALADAVPYVTAAYVGWFATTRIGRSEMAQLTKEIIFGNQAKAQAAAQAAASLQIEHAVATATLQTAQAERQRILAIAASNKTTLDKAASARALVAAEAQVATAQRVVTQTATAMTAAQAQAAMAARGLAAAQGAMAAVRAGLSGLLGMLGGPWGIAIMAATAGLYALATHESAAAKYAKEHADAMQMVSDSADTAEAALTRYKEKLAQMNEEARRFEQVKIAQKIKEIASSGSAYREVVNNITPIAGLTSWNGSEAYQKISAQIRPAAQILLPQNIGSTTIAQLEELKSTVMRLGSEFERTEQAIEAIKTIDALIVLKKQAEAIPQVMDSVADSARVAGEAIRGMFSPAQAKGLAEALADTQFKIDQLGRSAAQQATFDALRKANIDISKVSVDNKGQFAIEGGSADEVKQVQTLNDLNAQYVTLKDAADKKRQSGASAAKDYASSLSKVNDALAKLTMTEKEYAQYEFRKKYQEWLKDMGKVTPELERLLKLEETAFNAGYKDGNAMADHIKEVSKAIDNMGLSSKEKELKAFNEEMTKLRAVMGAGMATPFSGEQLDAWEEQRRKEIKSGKSADQNAQILREFNKEMISLIHGETEARRKAVEEQAQLYRDAGADRLQVEQWLHEKLLEVDDSWSAGAKRGFRDYIKSSSDASKQLENLVSGAFRGMEDALVQFTMTGKLSFKDMANSILSDLARIAAQQAISSIAGSLIKGLGMAFGGGVESTRPAGFVGPPKPDGTWAHGGAISGAGISAYSNSVVTSPTYFKYDTVSKFAKGDGLMGERGWEAVMPLTRTSGGDLAVRAVGEQQKGSGPINLTVRLENQSDKQLEAKEQRTQWSGDMRTGVVSIMIDAVNRNFMGARDALRS